MECKRCRKICIESELKEGFCLECYETFKGNISVLKIKDNSVAKFFKIISIVIIILGVLLGIIAFATNFGIFIALTCAFSLIIFSVFLIAIAEIIQLLEDIKNK